MQQFLHTSFRMGVCYNLEKTPNQTNTQGTKEFLITFTLVFWLIRTCKKMRQIHKQLSHLVLVFWAFWINLVFCVHQLWVLFLSSLLQKKN